MRAPILALAVLALAPAAAQAQSGSHIAFTQGDTPGVWTVPASGGTPTQLTTTGVLPSFSPNGKLMATIGPKGQIVVGSSSGTGATKVVGTETTGKYSPDYGAAAWSANSKQLAYTSNGSVFVVSASGGPAKQVFNTKKFGSNPATHPVFAPNGKALYFLLLPTNEAFENISTDPYRLYSWPLSGHKQAALEVVFPTLASGFWSKAPFSLSISPDGSTLALTAETIVGGSPTGYGVATVPVAGGQATITPGVTAAQYSPSGQLCGLASGGLVTIANGTASAPMLTNLNATSCTWAP
jgi:Tol biopolymer transport system component